MFSSTKLVELLPMLDGKFYYAKELVSSNDTAAELIEQGAGSGTLVLAERQSRGRGRRGNAWSCPAGEGLLFSLVLEPDIERYEWSRLALAAGLAVVDAIAKYGIEAKIKWPNDVWIDDKKCAGVLIEGCDNCVIVGVGVNVLEKHFPETLNATSLLLEGGEKVSREELLADIVRRLFFWESRCGQGFSDVVEAVNAHCALKGEMVQLTRNGERVTGMMIGTNLDGHLVLECAGELVSIAQADGIRKFRE